MTDPAPFAELLPPPASGDGSRSAADVPAEAGEPTDEALLAKFAHGDAEAFAQLYERHERPVYRFLRRSMSDAAAADDVMQEVWIAVMRNAAKFEPRARFTTWLYTIVRTRLIDHWRARRQWIALDDAAANDPDDAPMNAHQDRLAAPTHEQPEHRFETKAQARAFVAAVEGLPAAQREAFLLHAEAGFSVDDVARLTGVGRETAKSRLRYAMSRLRSTLEAWR